MSNGISNKHNDLFKQPVQVSIFDSGSCRQFEKITIRDGAWRTVSIPALFACIEHPHLGLILFDTGYSSHFFKATHQLPYAIYRWMTPVEWTKEQSAVYQLRQAGINPSDIQYVILSHFHADHIGGVQDFPQAKFIYLQSAYEHVKKRKGFSALRVAFLPDLMPSDFEQRALPIDETKLVSLPSSYPFKRGLDVFADGSVIAVDLPGHAAGQIGVLITTEKQPYFLCADAVWSSRAFRDRVPPHWVAGLIMDDRRAYEESFCRVHDFHKHHPEYHIVPSHCDEILRYSAEKKKL